MKNSKLKKGCKYRFCSNNSKNRDNSKFCTVDCSYCERIEETKDRFKKSIFSQKEVDEQISVAYEADYYRDRIENIIFSNNTKINRLLKECSVNDLEKMVNWLTDLSTLDSCKDKIIIKIINNCVKKYYEFNCDIRILFPTKIRNFIKCSIGGF